MLIRVLSFVLLVTVMPTFQFHAWAQVAQSGEASMLTPPPVNDTGFSREVGAEKRSNFLRIGLLFSTSYIDNLYAGSTTGTISETMYSIQPTIAFDTTAHLQHATVSYSPGFTFYHPSSSLNETDQNALVDYSYRLTPHATIHATDTFQKTSTSFSSTSPLSGTAPSSTQGVIAPFAEHLTNYANVGVSYQFSPTGMIGASGTFYKLHYPDLAEVPGLYDADERGGGFFYSHRVTDRQYVGANYRYSRILSYPKDSEIETQTHTFYFFYTIFLKRHLSLSVSGGPQYYEAAQNAAQQQAAVGQTSLPAVSSWSPAVTTSLGWQELHTNFIIRYARTVTSGGGLLGTFDSNSVNALARWQFARTWTAGASINYSTIKSVNPLFISSTLGGHTIAGTVTLEHPLTDRIRTLFEYDRLHQSYNGVAAVSSNPDSNRYMGSISWQFSRPLGR